MDRLNPGMRQEGWVNDLNGLIYYEGEYHLFAQRWNKCWIHAVSTNLVHWTELQPAFWEEALDTGVQSETCVVDYGNTSGLFTNPAIAPRARSQSFLARAKQILESGHSPRAVAERITAVEILVDQASIETFVNQGEIFATRFVLPHDNGLAVKAEGETVKIKSLALRPVKSARSTEINP